MSDDPSVAFPPVSSHRWWHYIIVIREVMGELISQNRGGGGGGMRVDGFKQKGVCVCSNFTDVIGWIRRGESLDMCVCVDMLTLLPITLAGPVLLFHCPPTCTDPPTPNLLPPLHLPPVTIVTVAVVWVWP